MASRQGSNIGRNRSRLPTEKRKEEILSAAQLVLAEYGYEHAAVAEVARRAGVVEGTVYHHFETKRLLFQQVAENWYRATLTAQQEDRLTGSLFDRLKQLIRREFLVVRNDPEIVRFILTELRPDPAYRDMEIFAMSRKLTSGIIELLQDGVKSGELDPNISLKVARDMIFGGVEHRTWAFWGGDGDFALEENAHSLATIIYKGLRSENPAAFPSASHGSQMASADNKELTERLDRMEKMIEKLAAK